MELIPAEKIKEIFLAKNPQKLREIYRKLSVAQRKTFKRDYPSFWKLQQGTQGRVRSASTRNKTGSLWNPQREDSVCDADFPSFYFD